MSNPPDQKQDQRFLKKYRVKLRNEFRAVYDLGTVVSDETLVIHGLRNNKDCSRIGLSIPKKVGSAPIRNEWKRWMREAFRLYRVDLPIGIDLIIRPRKDAVGSFDAVSKSVKLLSHKLDRKLPK